MWPFKKKKTDRDLLLESRTAVSDNAQTIEVLLVLAKGKDALIKELQDLQEKLKYLSPSTEDKVKDIDKKIKNLLGDIKIELNKHREGDDVGKTMRILEEIQVNVAERSLYTNR